MLIECGKCGAPLDVGEGQTIAKCIYCGGANRVARTRTLATETPAGWQAPATWQQPATSPRRTALFAAIATAVLVVAGVIAYAGQQGSEAVPLGATPAQIAGIELTITPAAFTTRFPSARLDDLTARVALQDPRYEALSVRWNPERDHLVWMYFDAAGVVDRSAVVAALRPHLGPRFQDDGDSTAMSWPAGGHLRVDPDGAVSWTSEPPDTSTQFDWRALGRAIWVVLRAALLGRQTPVDGMTREWIAGYSLERVAGASFTYVVDDAYRSIAATLPGTSTYLWASTLDVSVPIDHPWFGRVTLSWKNEAGGRLESMQITGLGQTLHDLDAVGRCLIPLVGAPEVTVTNHLRNERSLSWNRDAWWERGISANGNHIRVSTAPTPDLDERLRTLLRTLHGCGQ